MQVLVVDDSLTIRRIISKSLHEMGLKDVLEASNGKEALEKAKTATQLVLVLCDWNMPEMNGYQFLQKFRELDTHTPFVMVTTEAEQDRVLEAIKAGVTSYLKKPFTPAILQDKVKEILTCK